MTSTKQGARRRVSVVGIVRSVVRGCGDFVGEVVSILAACARLVIAPAVKVARPVPARGSTRRERPRRVEVPRDRVEPRPPSPARSRMLEQQRGRRRARIRGVALLGVVALGVVAWVTVPSASVFDVHHVEVRGTSSMPVLEVREEIDPFLAGETIYTLDAGAIERRLEELPFVRDASIDRHAPGGIEVVVSEYEPLALGVDRAGDGWLVAHDGRVLVAAKVRDWSGRIPVVKLDVEAASPGQRLDDEPALRVLGLVPADFPATITGVGRDASGMFLSIDGSDMTIKLGGSSELRTKLAVAHDAVDRLEASDSGPVSYVSVAVPARPVWGPPG